MEACSAGTCVGAGDPCDADEQCSESGDTCIRLCGDGNPAVAGACPEDDLDAGTPMDAGLDAGLDAGADAGSPPDAGATVDASGPTGRGDPGSAGRAGGGSSIDDGGSESAPDASEEGSSSSDCSCRAVGNSRSRSAAGPWLALAAVLTRGARRLRKR
jgi:hypothetical protein